MAPRCSPAHACTVQSQRPVARAFLRDFFVLNVSSSVSPRQADLQRVISKGEVQHLRGCVPPKEGKDEDSG